MEWWVTMYARLAEAPDYKRFSLRILSGKAWEDRPVVLRQIDQIGDKSLVAVSFLVLTPNYQLALA